MCYMERDLPIDGLNAIAEKEANAKKPIYQMFNERQLLCLSLALPRLCYNSSS